MIDHFFSNTEKGSPFSLKSISIASSHGLRVEKLYFNRLNEVPTLVGYTRWEVVLINYIMALPFIRINDDIVEFIDYRVILIQFESYLKGIYIWGHRLFR